MRSRANLGVLVAAALSGLVSGSAMAAPHGLVFDQGGGVRMFGTDSNSCNGKDGCKANKDQGSATDKAATGKHSCKGMNACKGQGGCKTADNSCAGKNSCKGKGGCATDGSKHKE